MFSKKINKKKITKKTVKGYKNYKKSMKKIHRKKIYQLCK